MSVRLPTLTLILLDAETEEPRDALKAANAKQSYLFFLRLNVRTFFALLQTLQPELERIAMEDDCTDLDGNSKSDISAKITAVARRVLPALRHYRSWLKSNIAMVTAEIGETSVTIQIKELWKIYATTLTLLVASFEVAELPEIPYLLVEDEDTLGFKPFGDEHSRSENSRYFNRGTGSPKPRFSENGVERCHPNQEMLGRIKDFLADGVYLAVACVGLAKIRESVRQCLLSNHRKSTSLLTLTKLPRPSCTGRMVCLPSFFQVRSLNMLQCRRPILHGKKSHTQPLPMLLRSLMTKDPYLHLLPCLRIQQ